MAHVAKECCFCLVELTKASIGFAETLVGLGKLVASFDDFPLHALRSVAELLSEFAGLNQVGYVFYSVKNVGDFALSGQNRDVFGAPIFALEGTVGPADVVFLHGHRVGSSGLKNALEGGPEIAHSCRVTVVRIVGEHFENAVSQSVLASGVGCAEPCVRCRHHGETWGVRQEHEQNVGRLIEQELKVQQGRVERYRHLSHFFGLLPTSTGRQGVFGARACLVPYGVHTDRCGPSWILMDSPFFPCFLGAASGGRP